MTARTTAVVVGASISGLLAARVLSKHFQRVILIEADQISQFPEVRKGQAQAFHTHVLLAKGIEIFSRYFPNLLKQLEQIGVGSLDLAQDLNWYVGSEKRKQFKSNIPILFVSRACLEYFLRKELLTINNIVLKDHTKVSGIEFDQSLGIITATKIRGQNQISTDFLVDATGRTAASNLWLKQFGFVEPKSSEVKVGIGYSTQIYKSTEKIPALMFSAVPPSVTQMATAFPVEGKKFIVGLAAWGNEYPPTDQEKFIKWIKQLSNQKIYRLISNSKTISDIYKFRFPASVYRHYEALRNLPDNLIVFGDALCSFNPVYGQGMTAAALQAEILDSLLSKALTDKNLSRQFYQDSKKQLKTLWKLAITEDFRFPTTAGDRCWDTSLLNLIIPRIHRATCYDEQVCNAFLRAANLLTPPSSLLNPILAIRILWV